MPRTRSKSTNFKASVTERGSYKEDSGTSDDDCEEPGLLTNILGFLFNMQRRSAQKKTRKRSPRKAPKRKQSTGGCDCPHCSLITPKRMCTNRKAQRKGKAKAQSSTSTTDNGTLNLESDDEEVVGTSITETHVDSIKNKVDNFFKALDSDEDELESKLNTNPPPPKPTEEKGKDFYTILTDSEDEQEKPSTSANTTSSFSKPSTSGLPNCISNGLQLVSQTYNKIQEKKPEDLFSYVDDILNDCNIVDITNDRSRENVPVVSLEDLKKKTDEILCGVTSLIDDLKAKPKEPEKKDPESLEKDAPTCPICFEPLGGPRQTMATICGHMFCEPCIAKVVKTSRKCPTCRKLVTKAKYHPVYI